MRFIKVIIAIAIILLGIVFIIENLETLKHPLTLVLDLYLVNWKSPVVPVWVIVLFCFFLGAFTAALYGIYEVIVQRQTIRQLRHNLEIMALELKQAGIAAKSAAQAPESRTASRTE
ncbi:MAG: hypothetical protein M1438_15465 [Deltaproteobacteria bacterium]|nr:hypothetical protein [Deltaproteobacteria bacterium]